MNQDSEGLTHDRILQLSEMTAIEHKIDYTHAATDSKYSLILPPQSLDTIYCELFTCSSVLKLSLRKSALSASSFIA